MEVEKNMETKRRKRSVVVWLTEEEYERVKGLCRRYAIPMSAILRLFLLTEAERLEKVKEDVGRALK